MDKLKEFFTQKSVMITESVLLILGALSLIYTGSTLVGIAKFIQYILGGVVGIDGIVTLITAFLTKDE